MALLPLQLPTLQNWSCHNCGGCCTQHLIEITDEERQRIVRQGWTAADGVTQEPIVKLSGSGANARYRLAHRPDGGCVFLNDQGLCRIHAKFGEPAKPLACRVYPYALHPSGKSIAVSLRFSCPSVIANKGRPVSQQKQDLQEIERLVVPDGAEKIPAPALAPGSRVDWPEFRLVNDRLCSLMGEARVPLLVRIFRGLGWANLIGQSQLSTLPRTQLREFLDLLTSAVRTEFPQVPEPIEPPGRVGRLYFRLFAAQYARKDTVQTLSQGWLGRWRLFRSILKFTRGRGEVPALRPELRPVPFAALESPRGGLPAGVDELFTRYWVTKLEGLHHCGRAFYGVPVVEGFHSLMLVFPVTMWLARWHASSAGREDVQLADVEFALAAVDHHHGYSEALGQKQARSRVRYLADSGELTRLAVWYAR